MRAPPGAPRRAAANFGRVLEDVESAHASADGLGRPFEVALPFEEARSDEAGAAWDQALAFVEETVGPALVVHRERICFGVLRVDVLEQLGPRACAQAWQGREQRVRRAEPS